MSVGKRKQKSVKKGKQKVNEDEASLWEKKKTAMKKGKGIMVEDDVDFNNSSSESLPTSFDSSIAQTTKLNLVVSD
ncbi:hypothetical protein Tco_1212428 [Tanacetum coccineum]